MKKVLITGASGFLGNHLLNQAPGDAKILAQFRSRKIKSVYPNISYLCFDLTQPQWNEVIAFRPDLIIHCAAMSKPELCERQPERVRQINYEASVQLTDLAEQLGARLIFTSSDVIYDGIKGDYTETDPPHPLNVYARTKVDAENYILNFHSNAVVIRCALIYGRALTGSPTFTEQIVNHLRNDQPVKLFTDEFRTPVLVNQLAAALWELAGSDFSGILNIGGTQKISRFEMGQIICEILHLPANLLVPQKTADFNFLAQRPRDCSFNISLAQEVLKIRLLSFAEGIKLAFSSDYL
jgi:dTDP-4-dehydrorhamnose reductase